MTDKLNCSILNCISFIDNKNVIYFRYPLENKELLQKWLDQIKRPNWQPVKGNVICSRHFKMSDIDNPLNKNIASLKPNAIPTIFPNKSTPEKMSNKIQITPKTVRSSMIVRKQIDTKSPGSVILFPVNKETNRTQVIVKSPVIVSKAKTTGMTVIKPNVSTTVTPKASPGRKRKNVEIRKEPEEKSEESENQGKKSNIQKKPMLRICVNKQYKHSKNGVMKEKEKNDIEKARKGIKEAERERRLVDQIEADTVIFKLDPLTREIVILKKTVNNDEVEDSNIAPSPAKRSRLSDSKPQKSLKEIYVKTVKSCQSLEEKLVMLQKKQLEEQMEIELLQKQLLSLQKLSRMQDQKKSTNEVANKSNSSNDKKWNDKETCNLTNNNRDSKNSSNGIDKTTMKTISQIIAGNSSDDDSNFLVEFLEPEFMS